MTFILRESMGKNARQHAENLNWEESISSLKKLFHKLTSN